MATKKNVVKKEAPKKVAPKVVKEQKKKTPVKKEVVKKEVVKKDKPVVRKKAVKESMVEEPPVKMIFEPETGATVIKPPVVVPESAPVPEVVYSPEEGALNRMRNNFQKMKDCLKGGK